ncbi:MAG: class I SAM-dependent methyltransferase [Nitrospinae bacterium]|jgi:2-polyprenyl-3-methyl-5-hydroxy-6-metoxy-1,4-benzoquinol methylase|nr:class I SAM-dependent methyltransferase [Nitrospinota bacterium]MDA1110596.1 class I SAM-dependent methyltransferase [Nitrospinota bacterium]
MTADLAKNHDLQEKVLAENRRVHALEGESYLSRHPEQTNFFQTGILRKSIHQLCARLGNEESRILDLGCGTGYLYLKLLAEGYRMTGVDLSKEMVAGLKGKIPVASMSRSSLSVMAVEEFVETDVETYDAVVMSALLHHLYDYQSLVRKVCRKLPPGGLFWVFFEPLQQEITSPFRYLLHKRIARLDETAYQFEMKARRIPLFEEAYDLSDYQRRFGGIDPNGLIDVLQSEGLQIIDVEKYCSRRYGLPAFLATHLLGTQNTFNLLAQKRSIAD